MNALRYFLPMLFATSLTLVVAALIRKLINPSSIVGHVVEHNIGFAIIQIVTKDGYASRITIFPKVDHEIVVTLEGPNAPSVTLVCSGGRIAARELDSFKWSSVIYHNKTNDEIKSWQYR